LLFGKKDGKTCRVVQGLCRVLGAKKRRFERGNVGYVEYVGFSPTSLRTYEDNFSYARMFPITIHTLHTLHKKKKKKKSERKNDIL
jgi:hypothetical protein